MSFDAAKEYHKLLVREWEIAYERPCSVDLPNAAESAALYGLERLILARAEQVPSGMALAMADAPSIADAIQRAKNDSLEEAAKLVDYRGQCAVQMINAEERIEEKKAYAWDALQHGAAIRDLKRTGPHGSEPSHPAAPMPPKEK